MIFADARALLNDAEACFAIDDVTTSPEDIALLSEWSNSQDAFGERAREVCQKLFDVYGTRLSVMNRGVFPGDIYFCGDYNNALFLRAKGMGVTPATNWVGTQTLITMDGKDYFRRRYACAS